MDKHWAQRHILDPLTEPEPSQETGLGSSHVDPRRFSAPSRSLFLPPTPPHTPSPPRYSLPALGSPRSAVPNRRSQPTPLREIPTRFRPHCAHHDTSSHCRDRCPPYSDPFLRESDAVAPPDYWSIDYRDSRTPSAMGSYDTPRTSLLLGGQQIDYAAVTSSPAGSNPRRPRSLSPNFYKSLASSSSRHPSDLPRSRLSGDMSDRPLDKIRAEARAADRRHRQRKRATYTDGIDRLDTIGGSYHHGGPFDAALPCRNRIKKYSPLAAVQESNMEAIRATPRENLVDSLSQNVPLQGTAAIAPGATDLSGNVMDYVEGPDLMREDDAPGGAYKRWSGIPYHPSDLKGKGEPSFTLERILKAKKRQKYSSMPASAFEMLPGINTRERPASVMPDSLTPGDVFASGDLQRSRSAKLGEGIKRRLGSFRRKKTMPAGEAY